MKSWIDMSIGMLTLSRCDLYDWSYLLYSYPRRSIQADVTLVIENAMRYNKPGTLYYKAAQRILSSSATVLAELSNSRTSSSSELLAHNEHEEIMVNNFVQPSISTIGNLEPPLALLDLLVSPDIADELNIVFHTDPLRFLLAYKLPEFKLPPMAPVQPDPPSRKTKRERKAELAKKRAEQHASTIAPTAEVDSETLTDINPKASFALFDKGWILDPGVRRGGRAQIERLPGRLTKKPPKVDSSPSAARPSTPPGTSGEYQMIGVSLDTDNQSILSKTPAWPSETDEFMAFPSESGKFLSGPGVIPVQGAMPVPQVIGHGQDTQPPHEEHYNAIQRSEPPLSVPPSSDEQPSGLTLAEARLKFKLEPNMTLSQDPDGKLVIQELDSPVTRREKAIRKKRARSQLEAPMIAACSALDGSDLSSLSELSEDDDGNVHIKEKVDKTKTTATQPGQVVLEDGKMLEGGTLGETIIISTCL